MVRTNPKGFYQERPDGKGGWTPGGFPPTIFNLPEVLKAEFVLVPEGEKDCLAGATLNFTATTNPGGAGAARPVLKRIPLSRSLSY